MKRAIIVLAALTLAALLSGSTYAGDKGGGYTIRDKNYQVEGYYRNGKIYDRNYKIQGYVDRDKIYDREYRVKGYLERDNRGGGKAVGKPRP